MSMLDLGKEAVGEVIFVESKFGGVAFGANPTPPCAYTPPPTVGIFSGAANSFGQWHLSLGSDS